MRTDNIVKFFITCTVLCMLAAVALGIYGCGVAASHADGGVQVTNIAGPNGTNCYALSSNGTYFGGNCQ